jgi:carboxynorspermidine decarboxylase
MFNTQKFDPNTVPSPCFVVDEAALRDNLEALADIRRRSGAKVLLALKAFAMFDQFPLIREYLDGTCASGLYEARLGREEFQKEVHTFSPAYTEEEFGDILRLSDHIIFNSFSQWQRFKPICMEKGDTRRFGLRINPECSEAPVALYDPCAPKSRLGIRRAEFEEKDLDGITGLHFHVLCEQNADALGRTLGAVERGFGELLPALQWLNFGGGHHITRSDYDRELLCQLVLRFRETYGVSVYLEPGEAVALNAGILVASVQDVIQNEMDIAILDVSATCHMPDVLEMPYRPEVLNAALPGDKPYSYRLAGPSCLAGDVIGDYSFDEPFGIGDRLLFMDMAHYTMVKTTMFNGMKHPAIAAWDADSGNMRIVRQFTYEDYRSRMG